MSLFLALQSATYQGVLWGIMAVGVYIPSARYCRYDM